MLWAWLNVLWVWLQLQEEKEEKSVVSATKDSTDLKESSGSTGGCGQLLLRS